VQLGRIVLDPTGALAKSMGVPGTPFGFGIDSQGVIRSVGLPNVAADVRELGQHENVGAR
jgi:hypothetical protein